MREVACRLSFRGCMALQSVQVMGQGKIERRSVNEGSCSEGKIDHEEAVKNGFRELF